MAINAWDSLLLGDVVTLQRGFDLPSRLRRPGTVPLVSSSGITDTHNHSRANGPGVVTGRYGTIGEVFFIDEDFWPHNTTLFVSDFKGNDPLFIYFLLKTIDYKTYSEKSGVPGVNRNDLYEISIRLPPIEEQRVIAQALSEVDALIAALDKLIAKKRQIKTGTIQQLLAGKKRLPGFGEGKGYKKTEIGVIPEDWDVRPLGNLIDRLEAGISVNSIEEDNDDYGHEESVLKTSSVFNGEFFPKESKKIIPKDIGRAKINPQKNTIIISRMNTQALVGECGYVDKNYNNLFLPDRLWITRFKKDIPISVRWLAYILSYSSFNKAIKDMATGTSGSMKNIAKEGLLQITILCPKEEEQKAIAAVLSDMDAEIAALETRRAKTQAIKQGMMQELLTGKTRLI